MGGRDATSLAVAGVLGTVLPAAHGRLGTLIFTGQTGLRRQPVVSERSVVWQMASSGFSTSTPYRVVWLAVVIMARGEGVWPLLAWPGH